jgi:hypothetical protein
VESLFEVLVCWYDAGRIRDPAMRVFRGAVALTSSSFKHGRLSSHGDMLDGTAGTRKGDDHGGSGAQVERARRAWLRYSAGGQASRNLSRQCSIKLRLVKVITSDSHNDL